MADSRRRSPLPAEGDVDRVHAALREQILRGRLPRGSALRQEALASEFGVSRTPLREALRRLASEGLVEFQLHRGARIVDPSPADLVAAYEARLVVESAAACLAADRATPDDGRRLAVAIADQRAAVGDIDRSYCANREFHLAVVAATGNDMLVRVAESLWLPGLGYFVYERQQRLGPVAVEQDVREHEAIAAAVVGGNAEAAGDLMAAHITAAMGAYADA